MYTESNYIAHLPHNNYESAQDLKSYINAKLPIVAFNNIAGSMAGYSYVKVVSNEMTTPFIL